MNAGVMMIIPALIALVAAAAPPALDPPEREVLATVDAFFAAVARKDRQALDGLVIADGLATAVRLKDGQPTQIMNWHWNAYFEGALAAPAAFEEKLSKPEVRVERDIATVWARYELLLDGTFSHCGVDHFDLIRRDGRWHVYNLTWTNQKTGCPGR